MSYPSNLQLEAEYPQGKVVECVVQRVEPFGVFVRLVSDPSVVGLVRDSDLHWLRGSESLSSTRRGETLYAHVVGREGRRLALSRHFSLSGPTIEFRNKHTVGQVVLGQVLCALPERGVRVNLSGGVSGFVPRSEIPDHFASCEGFGVLPHDWVEAEILGYTEEDVRLSIKEHLKRQDSEQTALGAESRSGLRFHPSVNPQEVDVYFSLKLREYPEPEIDPELRAKIRRILIVEDCKTVSESLELLFDHYGLPTDIAASLDEALGTLSEDRYDILILNITFEIATILPLLRDIRCRGMQFYILLLTGTPEEEWKELVAGESALVADFLRKPTQAVDILQKLSQHFMGQVPALNHRAQISSLSSEDLGYASPPHTRAGTANAPRKRIKALLRQTAQETLANRACVLSYCPGSRFKRIAGIGDFPDLTPKVCQVLDSSPVGDVMKSRTPLFVPDVTKHPEQFRHLQHILSTGSFVGYPLTHADQADYGLFLFGDRPGQFHGVSENTLLTAAIRISQLIAEERLDTVIADNQGLLLTGVLTDSLMHDIKNDIQALDSYSAIQIDLARRYGDDLRKMTPEDTRHLKRSFLELGDVTQHLRGLVQLFRNLPGRPCAEVIDLNALVRGVIATLQPFAERRHVVLSAAEYSQLPELQIRPDLIAQPLFNIAINGIEQAMANGLAIRWVRIAAEYCPEHEYPVRLTIQDNGPGVHTVHQARVFDRYFTTKEEGAGLGLYIARLFILRAGGRLYLSRTLRFSGTEFTIDFSRNVIS